MVKSKSKRKRVSKEHIRANAKKGARGNNSSLLTLPDDVREFYPEEKGTLELNMVPYEVTIDNHPDGVEKGSLWYKYPYAIHRDIGPNSERVLCPASFGKPCPICQRRQKLIKKCWDDNEEEIKATRQQQMVAYQILDPEDENKRAVMNYGHYKFGKKLDTEIEEGDDSIVNFYDVNDDGKTLSVRFSKKTYEGSEFLEASRIDFNDRDAMDEDEILDNAVCLDEIFEKNLLSYDKLKEMYFQVDGDEVEEDDEPKKKLAKSTKGKPAKGKKEDDEEDESEEDEDAEEEAEEEADEDESEEDEEDSEEDEDEKPAKGKAGKDAKGGGKFKVGAKVTFTWKGKPISGKVIAIDDTDGELTIEDAKGVEYDIDPKNAKAAGAGGKDEKPAKGKKDEPEEDEEEAEESEESEDEDSEEEEDDDEIKVGSEVTWKVGKETKTGTVKKLHSSGEKASVEDEDGAKAWINLDKLTKE